MEETLTARALYYATEEFQVPMICDRPAKEAIAEVISAFNCFAPEDDCTYLSSEITTGQRFYELLTHHGVQSSEELKKKLGSEFPRIWQELMKENLAQGYAFFDWMHAQRFRNLIHPGPFFARGWHLDHYLYLWEWVIIHKCCETRFNRGWNYRNGC